MCRVLGVSRSGYYTWLKRAPSARSEEDERLKVRIDEIHEESRGTYGVPRIYMELKEEDERVGRKRIARLMRDLGLRGVCRRRFVKTTQRDDAERPAPDLVERNFSASKPNELWVADATYVPTWEGFLFLAVVLDVFSRRIVGWAMANHLRTELMLDALTMAYNAIDQGAAGVDMGRNIFQADAPTAMIQAVGRVVHEGMKPQEALEFYETLKKGLAR